MIKQLKVQLMGQINFIYFISFRNYDGLAGGGGVFQPWTPPPVDWGGDTGGTNLPDKRPCAWAQV